MNINFMNKDFKQMSIQNLEGHNYDSLLWSGLQNDM